MEELLDDREFISWAIHGTHQKEWELLFNENSGLRNKALKAKKIIHLLKDTGNDLTEENILELWQHIEQFDNRQHPVRKYVKLTTVLRIAAVFILLVALGITVYVLMPGRKTGYEFAAAQSENTSNEARLILSSGDEINLKKDNSSIALSADEQIRINNDSLIDLRQKEKTGSDKMNEVIVPYGKKSQLVLADGTKVWLNAGSRLAFPTRFTGNKREVYLEGEAYFEVIKSDNKPFSVNAREVMVRVLGTRFNVSAYANDNAIETVLVEGYVNLSEQSESGLFRKEIVLVPGQLASYN